MFQRCIFRTIFHKRRFCTSALVKSFCICVCQAAQSSVQAPQVIPASFIHILKPCVWTFPIHVPLTSWFMHNFEGFQLSGNSLGVQDDAKSWHNALRNNQMLWNIEMLARGMLRGKKEVKWAPLSEIMLCFHAFLFILCISVRKAFTSFLEIASSHFWVIICRSFYNLLYVGVFSLRQISSSSFTAPPWVVNISQFAKMFMLCASECVI